MLVDDGRALNQVRTPAVTDLGDSVAFGTQGGTILTGSVVVVDKRPMRQPPTWARSRTRAPTR